MVQARILRRGDAPASRRASWVCGAVAALAVTGVYFIGAGRAYGLDASVTVHRFVATSSLLDPLRKQLAYNNHPLFSFVDHLVYSATGSKAEWVLRIVPIVASGLAVGTVTWAVARRLGVLASVVAGAVVATNSTLVLAGRDARGYSLLLLACIVSTVLLPDLLRDRDSRLKDAGYVGALAGGVATHLYGLAMLPLHAAIVGPRGAQLRRLFPRWVVAAGLGLLAYVGIAGTMLHTHQGRQFQPDFPLTLAKALLGGRPDNQVTPVGHPRPLVPVVLLSIPLIAGGLRLLFREWVLRAGVMAATLVVATWVIAPRSLYPRFFIWLVPAIAYIVAAGVSRWRVLMVVVVAFLAVEAIRFGPYYEKSEYANRGAARIAMRVARAGGTPCVGWLTAFTMEAYATRLRVVHTTSRPPRCDVIFALTYRDFAPVGPPTSAVLPMSWRGFPEKKVLDAANPGVMFYKTARRSARVRVMSP